MLTWYLLGIIVADQSEEKNEKFAEGLRRGDDYESLPAEFWKGIVDVSIMNKE